MAEKTMQELLDGGSYLKIPKVGEVVQGNIISVGRREVRIDIDGVKIGVIRGREIFSESKEYTGLKPGEVVEATVIDLENENGEIELSFRFAGQKKAWEELRRLFTSGDSISVKIMDANKGGLIIELEHITGFLPVSQLAPEHYPRVSGGDKTKILEKLKSFIGSEMEVRVFDVNEGEAKLIVSEKALWEERQRDVIAKHKVGDIIEGDITAVADFGAFVKFDSLEGLVHISELAWQRIDHPRDVVKVGDHVKAEVIGIEGSKIFLSMKKLMADPWEGVETKYKIGEMVEGKVLKINPFGFFVELDQDIHGLAHVSELSDTPVDDMAKIGSIGDTMKFRIVSIEPNEHRLGLSLKKDWKPEEPKTEAPKAEESKEEEKAEEPKVEEVKAEEEKIEETKTE